MFYLFWVLLILNFALKIETEELMNFDYLHLNDEDLRVSSQNRFGLDENITRLNSFFNS